MFVSHMESGSGEEGSPSLQELLGRGPRSMCVYVRVWCVGLFTYIDMYLHILHTVIFLFVFIFFFLARLDIVG